MNNKFLNILIISFLLFITGVNFCSAGVLTGDTLEKMGTQAQNLRQQAGYEDTDIGSTVSVVIEAFLSLLSLIFIILILYAGYNWMTAGGDEPKVTKSKDTIYRAVIGLVITISAFVLTYFVFNALPFGGGPTIAP